jgi:hypothetical protein
MTRHVAVLSPKLATLEAASDSAAKQAASIEAAIKELQQQVIDDDGVFCHGFHVCILRHLAS